MPRKQHIVRLSRDDRRTLQTMVRTGHRSAWSLQRARILLAADAAADSPAWSDAAVAEAVGVSARTVARVRSAWVTHGLACLTRTPQARPSVPAKLSTAQTLELAALACTDPPPGHARWSLRLLAARVVELEIVEAITHETVRRALQKGGSSRGAPSAS
ncbi:MAG: helix-turn-helix domain-containing protein [Chloroflexota bacterium]|nr:helix-turn-helix domain-containing protein [Chloroflexota bacterium]